MSRQTNYTYVNMKTLSLNEMERVSGGKSLGCGILDMV